MTKLEQLFADLATLLGPLRSIVTLHPDEALAANRAVVTLRDENPGDLIQKHFEDKHKELLAADAEDDETEAEATDTPETDETSATAPETGVSVEPVNEGAPIISDTPMNAETGTESPSQVDGSRVSAPAPKARTPKFRLPSRLTANPRRTVRRKT